MLLIDPSLIRNSIAYKISELMKFKFTARCKPVDVVLNENFQGNNYICDKIEVDKNRINITKMEMTDISEPNVTGGYVLEIDSLSAWEKIILKLREVYLDKLFIQKMIKLLQSSLII